MDNADDVLMHAMSTEDETDEFWPEQHGDYGDEVSVPYRPTATQYRDDCEIVDWVRGKPAWFAEGGRWLKNCYGLASISGIVRDPVDDRADDVREADAADALMFNALIRHEEWTELWDVEDGERRIRAKAILVAHWLMIEPVVQGDCLAITPWALRAFSANGLGRRSIRDVILGQRMNPDNVDTNADLRSSWLRCVQVAVVELRRSAHGMSGSPAIAQQVHASSASAASIDGTFMRDVAGFFWTIAFCGKTISISHMAGFEYIRALIQRSPDAVSVADLRPGEGSEDLGYEKADEEAQREYSRRLIQIEDELSTLGVNDKARESVEKEKRHLMKHLKDSRSGSRGCFDNSPHERRRKAVGNAIRKALDRLRREFPDLCEHFERSIAGPSGFNPRYEPKGVKVNWRL